MKGDQAKMADEGKTRPDKGSRIPIFVFFTQEEQQEEEEEARPVVTIYPTRPRGNFQTVATAGT